jgi:hypothetical protein
LKVIAPVGVPNGPDNVTSIDTLAPGIDGLADDRTCHETIARTVCPPASVPVLPECIALPLYTAVIAWTPGDKAVVANVATPLVSATGAPSGTEPSMNWTVPPAPTGDTRAVNVAV